MFDPNLTILTPRLTISHYDPSNTAHCQLIFELNNAPSTQALGAAVLLPDFDAARAFVAKGAHTMRTTGFGAYLICLREVAPGSEPTCIGMVSMGMNRLPDAPHPCPKIPDLGFGLLQEFQGKGYASEAAAALLQHYREKRGYEAFAGFTDERNEGAAKLFGRLGWKSWGVRDVWGVKREAWKCAVWTDGIEGGEEALVDAGIVSGKGSEVK